MSYRAALTWLFTALVSTACSVPQPDRAIIGLLFVPTGADILPDAAKPVATENGRSMFADGSTSVSFALLGEREPLSAAIVSHFASLDWRERSAQYLNPQIPTSFTEGWKRLESGIFLLDAQGRPVRQDAVYQWRGEWEDSGGNVVTYSLFAQAHQLRGYAAHVPRVLVDATRR